MPPCPLSLRMLPHEKSLWGRGHKLVWRIVFPEYMDTPKGWEWLFIKAIYHTVLGIAWNTLSPTYLRVTAARARMSFKSLKRRALNPVLKNISIGSSTYFFKNIMIFLTSELYVWSSIGPFICSTPLSSKSV